MDINQRIAERIRTTRDAQSLSLAELAARSGVSRSTISLIERNESSATATVLDKLTAALGITMAALFEEASGNAPSPLSRFDEQAIWTDPASGYVRRTLSPGQVSPIQLAEVSFPPGQRVAYDTAAREAEVYQQVWIIEGAMTISVGATAWPLARGDCLAMRLDQPITFHNPSDAPARYLVALVTQVYKSVRRE